jgi:hypothetical protein
MASFHESDYHTDYRTGNEPCISSPPTRGDRSLSDGHATDRLDRLVAMGSQRAHHDAIVHLGDTGRPPGHSFGFIALEPGTHLSLEYDLSAACLDGDLICINFGTAPEGLLDFLLDVGGLDARLGFDVVDNALYTL